MPLRHVPLRAVVNRSARVPLIAPAHGQQQLKPLSGDASDYLVDSLTRQRGALLEALPGEGPEQARQQLKQANGFLVWLPQRMHSQPAARYALRPVDVVSESFNEEHQ